MLFSHTNIFFLVVILLSNSLVYSSIPLDYLDGNWLLNVIEVERDTGLTLNKQENIEVTTEHNNKQLTLYRNETESKYFLVAINSTSFLFDCTETKDPNHFFNYPFIFSVFPIDNMFFASFQAKKDVWADITVTSQITTITMVAHGSNTTSMIVAYLKTIDDRSFFKRYYLLILVAFYLLIIALPTYISKCLHPPPNQTNQCN
ncbi:Two tm domain protein [Entamoeba marina]